MLVQGRANLQDQGLYIMPLGRHVCKIPGYKAGQFDAAPGGVRSNHHHICAYLQQREGLPVRLVADAPALKTTQQRGSRCAENA